MEFRPGNTWLSDRLKALRAAGMLTYLCAAFYACGQSQKSDSLQVVVHYAFGKLKAESNL